MAGNTWVRVNKRQLCPVCGKPDWCMIARDGTAAICPRTSEGAERYLDGSGWLHKLGNAKAPRRPPPKPPRRPKIDAGAVMAECQRAVDSLRVVSLARDLGVSALSLRRLGIGWSVQWQAFAFPMCDSAGRVIGIRLRNEQGDKWAVPGSRNGLFLPSREKRNPLLICEGPTDTAAMVSLDFDVVGRPACRGCEDMVVAILRQEPYTEVAIMADNDAPKADGSRPGQEGARELAERIRSLVYAVKVVIPPVKDVRAWVREGAKRRDVLGLIARAEDIGFRSRPLSRVAAKNGGHNRRTTRVAGRGSEATRADHGRVESVT